jgi:uncharacterized protein (DUF1810 family)
MQQEKKENYAFNLQRFISIQEGATSYPAYTQALSELKAGKKGLHWMWYIFPQLDSLGSSPMAREYSIKNLDEARSYLQHPVLGARLRECAQLLYEIQGKTAFDIFGGTDSKKLRSSMTLFELVSEDESLFTQVLDKYFQGIRDSATLEKLNRQ